MSRLKKIRLETYWEAKSSFFYFIIKKIILNARNKFFKQFVYYTKYKNNKSVLDIGTTPSLDEEHNIILEKTKKNKKITCLSNNDCKILSSKFRHLKSFIIGDAKKTRLKSNSFDIVHSNATIEHVGSYKNQILFVKEAVRVSKKFIFIQTPNRFFPIDPHTNLPFIHWLPKNLHRKFLKFFDLDFYSLEKNLNLLSKKDLYGICKILKLKKFKIIKYKLFFITSNLILVIEK